MIFLGLKSGDCSLKLWFGLLEREDGRRVGRVLGQVGSDECFVLKGWDGGGKGFESWVYDVTITNAIIVLVIGNIFDTIIIIFRNPHIYKATKSNQSPPPAPTPTLKKFFTPKHNTNKFIRFNASTTSITLNLLHPQNQRWILNQPGKISNLCWTSAAQMGHFVSSTLESVSQTFHFVSQTFRSVFQAQQYAHRRQELV